MPRARNTTTAPTGSIAPLGLRLLPALREKIMLAASLSKRSMNAEIHSRLETTFDTQTPQIPDAMRQAISREQTLRGGTPEEAMTRIALTAMAQGGTILHVTLTPGTQYQQIKDMLKAGETIIPHDAAVVLESK